MEQSQQSQTTQRVALVIQYLGTHFYGWQRQPQNRSVQEEIENAICAKVGYQVKIHGAGRTDTGVHAAAQVAHFDIASPIPGHKWAKILNSYLPEDVLIRASDNTSNSWHAQYSASYRRYRYTIYNEELPNLFVNSFSWHYYYQALDEKLMESALRPLAGYHNLSAFRRSNSVRPHSWVEVQAVECYRIGSFIHIEIQADGFLYGMVRLLVGMIVLVGSRKISVAEFTDIWKQQRRGVVKYAAPPQGLCLLRVGYENFPFFSDIYFDTQPKFLFSELVMTR
ncbi:MAG: tRNA pseudouridine(38-40) synthase TruA [Cyanobacteria bacterium P01_A01_bin.45]